MLHCPRLLLIASNSHETLVNRPSNALPGVQALAPLFHVESVGSLGAALRRLDGDYFDVALLEASVGWDWRDAVAVLADHPGGVPVVVLKPGGNMSDWGAALRAGAFDLVATPCLDESLVAVCEHAVVTGEARRWHGITLQDQFISQVA